MIEGITSQPRRMDDALLPEGAAISPAPAFTQADNRFMQFALRQAAMAAAIGETPVGAVVVCDGLIVGRGRNRRELRTDATEHAEIMAIRQACRRLHSWRLSECDLYVTLEPCLMCAGAVINARIRRVIFAAPDPKAGACGSVVTAQDFPLMHAITCSGGLLADASARLLRNFFQDLRQRDRGRGSRGQRRGEAVSGRKRLWGPVAGQSPVPFKPLVNADEKRDNPTCT